MAKVIANGKPGHADIQWSTLEKGLAAFIVGGVITIIGAGFLAWRDLAVVQSEVHMHMNDNLRHNNGAAK